MTSDRLDKVFAALADPTRRAILARLASGEASVTELGQPFKMSLPAISKHLKVLERAGLITRGREAQSRPCRLQPDALKEAADWVEHYRRFWEQSLDRLGSFLDDTRTKNLVVTRRHSPKEVDLMERVQKQGGASANPCNGWDPQGSLDIHL